MGFIAIFIYFVSGVSATYPPIKEYNYSGTTSQFISIFRQYAETNSNLIFKVTDTTGNATNGHAIYLEIEMSNVEYTLKCIEDKSDTRNTAIWLVGAIDKSRNVGGYSKEAEGVEALVDVFDKDILASLKAKMGMEIR